MHFYDYFDSPNLFWCNLKASASDVDGGLQMGKEFGAVDGVKGYSEAEIDENVAVVCYRREVEVIGHFDKGCFCAVM